MIQRVYGKVTDESLRDFFKEYNPSQIYIFKVENQNSIL